MPNAPGHAASDAIESALSDQTPGFGVHFQPRFDVERWRVSAFEALLRFHGPAGPVSPLEVFTVAAGRSSATMGLNTGLVAVTERMELEAALERVRAAGVHEVQGYVFSRPVPPRELLERNFS